MINKIYLFATLPFLLNACCNISGDYLFEIPAKLSPAKDTFNIGDTIKIVSTFPNKVYDRTTNRLFTLENFKFYPSTLIQKIDVNPAIPKLQDYFYFVIDSSFNYRFNVYSTGDEGLYGQYTYSNGMYSLQFKLVTRQKGLFYIEQTIYPLLDSDQDFDGKCPRESADGIVIMNEGADNNVEMLNNSPDPHFNTWILQQPEERFHKFGGYCFYVK